MNFEEYTFLLLCVTFYYFLKCTKNCYGKKNTSKFSFLFCKLFLKTSLFKEATKYLRNYSTDSLDFYFKQKWIFFSVLNLNKYSYFLTNNLFYSFLTFMLQNIPKFLLTKYSQFVRQRSIAYLLKFI